MKEVTIREMKESDWNDVAKIYTEGIESGNATFEMDAPFWDKWNAGHLKHSRYVAECNNKIVGWAALSGVSDRCVYAGVAEVSVYVAADHRGKKIGHLLLSELIKSSEQHNVWTLQAGIFPENTASIKIHEKLGFRKVGYREKIGKMVNGIWRDTFLFERRSEVAGR